MELQMDSQSLHERRPHLTKKPRRVRWVKEWVSQDLASTGGKCLVLKWVREDVLKVLKERWNESVSEEREPEATSEVLFLCSFEGCGKTFIDAGALRKHSHVHGERQYACQYEGCGKKFLDSSKLKRHHLIHTGQRDYACPYEGCGKAFSLDFNLRAHMRTHTQENYHNCPYQDCGKRFAHDYKLQAHIRSYHEKNAAMNATKHHTVLEKPQSSIKRSAAIYTCTSTDRPYACPYEGCNKTYIHEYKLNLHLKREHPAPYPDGKGNHAPPTVDCEMSDPFFARGSSHKICKRNNAQLLVREAPPSKVQHRDPLLHSTEVSSIKSQWLARHVDEEDSEETEEDNDSMDEDERSGSSNNEETDED